MSPTPMVGTGRRRPTALALPAAPTLERCTNCGGWVWDYDTRGCSTCLTLAGRT